MKAYTRRRVMASTKLGFATIPFVVALYHTQGNGLAPGSFILGFGIGFGVGVAELFLFKNWLKQLSFPVHLAAKSFFFVGVM